MKSKAEQVDIIANILGRKEEPKLDHYLEKVERILAWHDVHSPRNFKISMFKDMHKWMRLGKFLTFKQRHAVDNVLSAFNIPE